MIVVIILSPSYFGHLYSSRNLWRKFSPAVLSCQAALAWSWKYPLGIKSFCSRVQYDDVKESKPEFVISGIYMADPSVKTGIINFQNQYYA